MTRDHESLLLRPFRALRGRLCNRLPVFYANKLWGHGRVAQLRLRASCWIFGHTWSRFNDGVRRCTNDCGGLTTASNTRCSKCGRRAAPLDGGWFGDLAGWVLGRGFIWCPECASFDVTGEEDGKKAPQLDGAFAPVDSGRPLGDAARGSSSAATSSFNDFNGACVECGENEDNCRCDDEFFEDLDCTHCCGDGICDDGADPLWDCPPEAHFCHACGGTGKRRDQRVF